MKYQTVLLKPASSLCNMRCKYCFYSEVSTQRKTASHGIMTRETVKAVIDSIFKELSDGDEVSFAFQGGEPTLAGLSFFKDFVSIVQSRRSGVFVNFSMQTNGLLLDELWCEFLSKNKFLTGLSLDGDYHDNNRIDASGCGTFNRVLKSMQLLDKYKVEYNILCVLTNRSARYPQKMWNFILKHNIKYIQFIPCLSDLNRELSPAALKPDRFASFYTELFSFWKKEFMSGNYISVKLFDDLFNLLIKKAVTACGFTGSCPTQIVVESDGSVYPCDFYSLDYWRLGNIKNQTISALKQTEKAKEFSSRDREEETLCISCKYIKICGGGCPKMKSNMYIGDNKAFCGYKAFLDNSRYKIEEVITLLSALKG